MFYKFFIKTKLVLIFSIILLFISPETIFAKKVSNKYEVKTFWEEHPITPGTAYYFIRTEKIEKRTKSLNNHPIKISEDVLRKMLKQLSYKYDNEHPEIPLFSKRELILLSKFVPQAFITAKSNEDDNNLLDLKNVRGIITSDIRDPIYIVSDFAQHNTSNSNSKFYQSVIINYIDKEITCENFDIDMETNMAIAYNDVIVTDPKSTMKAGIITFDLKTKNININPENEKTKVKVTTN